MTKIFSTDDVCPRDRIEYWVDKLGDAIAGRIRSRLDLASVGVAELESDGTGRILVSLVANHQTKD
jgi:hypothetical protein